MSDWLRRLGLLVVAASIAVGVVLALIGSNNKEQQSMSVPQIQSGLQGIPQSGNTLGKASTRIMEFADLECPACQEFHRQVASQLINQYIRTGKVQWQLQIIGLLGSSSRKASLQAYTAAQQNMMFQYSLAYYSLGSSAAYQFPGIRWANTTGSIQKASQDLAQAEQTARNMKIEETPSLFISKNGSKWQRIKLPELSWDNLKSAISKR